MTAVGRRILCFGDSNTYGYDPRSYLGGRYPASVRWTSLLEEAGWETVNEGANGRCIPRPEEAAALGRTFRRAEVLSVMLGSNDLLQRSEAEDCAEQMGRFLSALLEEAPPACRILLVAPPPMRPGTWVNDAETLEESRRLAGCYEALARRLGVYFADAGTWGVELAFDGVHFSGPGHRAFARGMLRTLERLGPILPPP